MFGTVSWQSVFQVPSLDRSCTADWTFTSEKSVGELLREQPVEVVLYEEGRPRSQDLVWSSASVKVVVWFRARGPADSICGWSCRTHVIDHRQVGGVTDGHFVVTVATRTPYPEVNLGELIGLEGVRLGQIMDPTIVAGSERAAPPSLGQDYTNTDFGVLSWRDRRSPVLTRNVRGGINCWVRRKLSPKELLLALDAPATLIKDGNEQLMEFWARHEFVPCKIRVEVLNAIAEVLEPHQKEPRDAPEIGEGDARKRSCRETAGCDGLSRLGHDVLEDREATSAAGIEQLEQARATTAAKADDAEIPVYLWNSRVRDGLSYPDVSSRDGCRKVDAALDGVRVFLLHCWKKRVAASFAAWWRGRRREASVRGQVPDMRSAEKGAAALSHVAEATWWDWDGGSAPFFWRFPEEFQEVLRDGEKPKFIGDPPAYTRPYREPKDPTVRQRQADKIQKVRARRYITTPKTPVLSLIDFFSVDKAKIMDLETGKETATDIRMVYNGSSSGLNSSLWAPWFALPPVEQTVRKVEPGTWGADNDVGEMFLNFWLHDDLQQYCGIDLTKLYPGERENLRTKHHWEVWTRLAMGLRPSPYGAYRNALVAKRVALGDPNDASNPFVWRDVELNLPGDASYSPSRPWVSKRRADGQIASDTDPYVDDWRNWAPTKELAWLAGSQLAKTCSYLGIQDAARKRRAPSQSPGPWTGVVIQSEAGNILVNGKIVWKTCAQDRWDKARHTVRALRQHYEERKLVPCQNGVMLNHKLLLSKRGYLTHMGRIFPDLVPYLKGLHLTIDSWRPGRDADGWRYSDGSFLTDGTGFAIDVCESAEAPTDVRAVPRFETNLFALERLTRTEEPPRIPVRPTDFAGVFFNFGDASGTGFGQTTWQLGRRGSAR